MEATAQRIGKFDFSVAVCETKPDIEAMRAERQGAITAWLLHQWDREREDARDDRHLHN